MSEVGGTLRSWPPATTSLWDTKYSRVGTLRREVAVIRHMQPPKNRPLTRVEAEARIQGMSRRISPTEREALIEAWTANAELLSTLFLSHDPNRALVAMDESQRRWKEGWDHPGTDQALAMCLTLKTDLIVRDKAALVLGQRNDKRSIPTLRMMLNSPAPSNPLQSPKALQSAFFLARFKDIKSYPGIHKLTTRLNDAEQRNLADVFAMMGDPKSVSLLRELLKNPYQGTRSHAALALGRVKDRSSVPALIHALTDGYSPVRRDAAWALAAIGDTKALPALKKAVTAQNSKHVPAHGFRGAQEMARRAVAALEKGKPLEIARDWRGDPVGFSHF